MKKDLLAFVAYVVAKQKHKLKWKPTSECIFKLVIVVNQCCRNCKLLVFYKIH